MDFSSVDLVRIGISIGCGALLGFEREYRNKSAGFRTLILITLGSTIFTMMSNYMGDDRIAANIITGIGFIGAGVIFKDNYSVTGLTTAAVIWIAAALGMVVGMADYELSVAVSLAVILILSVFHGFENLLDWVHNRKTLRVTFTNAEITSLEALEAHLLSAGLRFQRKEIAKHDGKLVVVLMVFGRKNRIKALVDDLLLNSQIEDFNFAQTSR
jgi:putative Mg2+ transporter-C (MgtC) family protein